MLVVPPTLDALLEPLRAALDGGEAVLVSDDPRVIAAARTDRPSDAALLVATSGSTGRPKVVELSAGALIASARGTEQALGGPGRWLLQLPLTFIAGLQVVIRSLVAGTTPVTEPARLGGPDGGRRYTAIVPTQLRRMLDADAHADELTGFDAVLVGGASTPPALVRRARERGANIVTTYGMTETAGGCVYDGVALPGARWRIDETIVLGGATIADGYRLDAERTAAAFGAGEFRTADLGAIGADRRLVVLGRADDVIISGGVNIHPHTVEAALAAQPGVRDCVVAGVPDDEWGQAVVAWVVGDVDPVELRAAVRAELGVATPRVIHRIDAVPLLPSGKPDRQALRRRR